MKQRKHEKYSELLANIEMGLDIYIHGPTGSGKTQGCSNASKELGLPFYKKVVGSTMSEAAIMGYVMGEQYIPGIAYKPFTEGGVLLLDEVDNGNANTNLIINGLCDGELAFPCGMKERHPKFVLITTANTMGQGPSLNYIGRNKQDVALLNRFVFLFWPYDTQLSYDISFDALQKAHKGEILGAEVHLLNKVFTDVEKFTQAIEELKIPHIISPRSMKQAALKIAGNRGLDEILNTVILKGLTKEQKMKILNLANGKKTQLDKLPKFNKPTPPSEQKPKESQEQKPTPPTPEKEEKEEETKKEKMEEQEIKLDVETTDNEKINQYIQVKMEELKKFSGVQMTTPEERSE